MTELSDEARRLLHAGRTGFSPTPQELDAAREALDAKLAMAQASAPTPDMPEPTQFGSATHAAAGSGGMLKLALVTFAASLAIGYMVWQLQRAPDAASSPRVSEPSSPPPGTPAPAEPAPADPREPHPATAPEATGTGPRARSRDAARARAKSHASQVAAPAAERAPSASAEPAPTAPPALAPPDSSQLAREIELIRRARTSLQQGRSEQTLETLDTYLTQFPNGALREEQLALRAIALCGLGRMDAAQAIIRRLEAAAPGSLHLRRLERACPKTP